MQRNNNETSQNESRHEGEQAKAHDTVVTAENTFQETDQFYVQGNCILPWRLTMLSL